jgi:hypothetical protein
MGRTLSSAFSKSLTGGSLVFSLDEVQGLVDDPLGRAAFAVVHEAVDELRHQPAAELGIGPDDSLGDFSSSGHRDSTLVSSHAP